MKKIIVDEKLLRDRRILKEIDLRLGRSVRWLVPVILAVTTLMLTLGEVSGSPVPIVVLSCIGLVLTFPLLYLSLRFRASYGAGPARWRRIFKVLSLLLHFWIGMAGAIFWHTGLSEDVRWILPVTAAIILVYESDDWAPYFQHHVLQVALTWLPLMLSLAYHLDISSALGAAATLAFSAVIVARSSKACQSFWAVQADLARHRNLASELSNEVSSVQTTSRTQADFLTSITREIRTPMNNVLGALSLLDDTELSPQQRQLQRVALSSGESLLAMTEDIMDFSKIASGNLVLTRSVFNLRKCLERCVEALGPIAHERHIELVLVLVGDVPVRVVGDRQRLSQVLHNLVLNAITYSGGTLVTVEANCDTAQDGSLRVNVAVRDDGKGITHAQRDVLFEAFSSSQMNDGRVVGGTGLGLAICNGLVKAMGGSILVETETGKGSCFRFNVILSTSSQQSQGDTRRYKALIGWRVLMVDLSPALRKGLLYYMGLWEMQCDEVAGEEEAVERLRQAVQTGMPYQLVIVNCPFENAEGFRFPAMLRAEPRLTSVKVMVLGTLAQKGTLGAAFIGVQSVEWVVKPFNKERLRDALAALAGVELTEGSHRVVRSGRRHSGRGAEGETGEISAMTLLLVEDNKVNQLVARSMLQKLGYAVQIVNNGREALGIVQERDFDAILMDCIMPEMDGYEATRAIRALEQSRNVAAGADKDGNRVPIIAMTANAGETEKRRCLDAGMDDCLFKPVDIADLDVRLKQWIKRPDRIRVSTEAVVNFSRKPA